MPACAYVGSILTSPTATETGPGTPTVTVNGQVIAVMQDNTSDGGKMVEGSPTVTAGVFGVCRLQDANSKGKKITSNVSPDVTIN